MIENKNDYLKLELAVMELVKEHGVENILDALNRNFKQSKVKITRIDK
ncbi:MAG: hypothetical protein JEZ08_16445 [Clostridiales bacterium]|nr:hypothetical protein [Clostridiales bacterium]